MSMEQLLRLRQTRGPPGGAAPSPNAAPPAGVVQRHELYVRSNDPNSDKAYALFKRVPTFRDVIDVHNISSTGTRPSWLQGTPCLLFRHSDGQQTRAHYGTQALQVLHMLAAQPEHATALADVFTTQVDSDFAGLAAAAGVGDGAAGFAIDLGNELDYQGVSDRYRGEGKLKDAQSSVDSLLAARNKQDGAVQHGKQGVAATFKPEDLLVSEQPGGSSMEAFQRMRMAQDAESQKRAQAHRQQFGDLPPPQMS